VKLALVAGSAACIWDDLRATERLGCKWDAVYCVKMTGIYWPTKFDVWVTLHPEAMDEYEAKRKAGGLPSGYEIVAPFPDELGNHGKKGNIARRVTYRWPGMTSSASSGIYGAKVALEDGFRVVLAGVPMTKMGGHFMPGALTVRTKQPRGNIWLERDSFEAGLRIAMPIMKQTNNVRSMSGLTQEILGAPTPEWLAGS